MANSDNPIFNTINDVLGLGHKPEGFIEKISALELMLSGPKRTFSGYEAVVRADKNLTAIEGSEVAKGKNVKAMFKKLNKAGLVPDSAETAFGVIGKTGASVFYNPSLQKLYYGEVGLRISPLPLQLSSGAISFGQSTRKANALGMDSGKFPMSFADAFYTQFGANALDRQTKAGIHTALKRTLNTDLNGTKLKELLLDITDLKGISTSNQASWTAGRSFPFLEKGHYFAEGLANYKIANAAQAMLIKTGGRMIYEELPGSPRNFQEAISQINNLRSDYLTNVLPNYLKELGAENAFPFVKADFLGNKDKFLIPDKNLNTVYGSKFESHTLTKGLFHLANIRTTSLSQIDRVAGLGQNPYSYYTMASDKAKYALKDMRLKVGVVDTLNPLYSQMYFGEGGAILSTRGSAKLAGQLPIGSIKLSSPTLTNINAAERLFGVNIGTGYTQSVSKRVMFTTSDVDQAFNLKLDAEDISDTAKDIRLFSRADKKYKGLMRQLARGDTSLSKLKLTDAALSLDFITAGDSVAETMEIIAGARRFSTTSSGPLKSLADQLGVDILIGADEYMKTYGPNVYLTNFIEKVSEQKIAEKTFRKVFGQASFSPGATVVGSRKIKVPVITDHDSAYQAALNQVSEWKASKSESLRRLADSIEHGTQVINATTVAGITGVRVVGMAGGLRTDFMGDINLSKAVRFTPSKMMVMAKGSAQLGYSSASQDPMFSYLTNLHSNWRSGNVFIDSKTNELGIGPNHILRRFSNSLIGNYTPSPEDIVSMQAGKPFYKGKELGAIPSMLDFSHGKGGVPFSELENTILGINKDMVYIDLGRQVKMNLLGIKNGEKMYRYLPVPLKYLRIQQGIHGKVVLNKSHPSYGFIKSLSEIGIDNNTPGTLQYSNILKAIVGSKGLFVKDSTIVVNSGARVRLSPGELYNRGKGISTAESLFHSSMSYNSFDDWLTRKDGMAPSTVADIRRQVAKKGYFHAIVGVDPMQRAEHANIHKVFVSPSSRASRSFLGQVSLVMHPFWYRMTERDLDRDVANLTPLVGDSAAYEGRIARQAKLAAPFMGFFNYELKNKVAPNSRDRLTGIKLIDNAIEYLSSYIGVPKSLGYTITRASDTIMNNVIGEGIDGARKLGMLGQNISSSMIEQIRAPYLADPERLSVVQKSLQYLYQGAVQKGTSKSELISLAEGLVSLGNEYKGKAFNAEIVKEKASDLMYNFLKSSDKHRAFMALDYLVEKNLISKESTKLLLDDLARGSADTLTEAAMKAGASFREESIRATANILGEYMGSAMVLAASLKKMPKTITGMIQKNIYPDSDEEDMVRSVIDAASDGSSANIFSKKEGLETALDNITDQIPKPGIGSKKGFGRVLKRTLANNKTAIGVAAGIGAIVGAGIAGMARGPQAPMPREVDGRQPMDTGPDVSYAPPRVYGTNQRFSASSNRSPQALPSVNSYKFRTDTKDSILIQNRNVNMTSYELERRMKQISQSDYTY